MTVTDTPRTPEQLQSDIASLQAQMAQLLQTQAAGSGGTYPHSAVLAGYPLHTITPPCDENGRPLEGAWNPSTGLWEDPATAEANRQKAEDDKAAAVSAAADQAKADAWAKAMAQAQAELEAEGQQSDLVAQAKEQLRGSTSATPDAESDPAVH